VREERVDDGLQAPVHHQVKLVQGGSDAAAGGTVLRLASLPA